MVNTENLPGGKTVKRASQNMPDPFLIHKQVQTEGP
jgi:hypothetical protein